MSIFKLQAQLQKIVPVIYSYSYLITIILTHEELDIKFLSIFT